jgi:predicted  nucleic acid-binding Zn-ribbon protein
MNQIKLAGMSLLLSMSLVTLAAAQQTKTKKPMKYPPQYPQILGTDDPSTPAKPENEVKEQPAPQQADVLQQSVNSLSQEVRQLAVEIRILNLRQEAQLEMLRLSRSEGRTTSLERELDSVTGRLAALDTEELQVKDRLVPVHLEQQVQTVVTLNRSETIEQLKQALEARLTQIAEERGRLQGRETELRNQLEIQQAASQEAERHVEQAEATIRQMTAPAPASAVEPSPPNRKP